MSPRMRIFIGIILILAFIYIFYSIKKKKIDIRHSLIWILVCIVLAILDIWPSLLQWITTALGFELPVNMLFFLGFAIAIGIIFGLTARVSKQSEQIKTLTQQIALLKKDVEDSQKS